METIKQKAKRILDTMFMSYGPVSINRFKQYPDEKYWAEKGRKICKNKLVEEFSKQCEQLKLECVINPLATFSIEPKILELENLINEISLL